MEPLEGEGPKVPFCPRELDPAISMLRDLVQTLSEYVGKQREQKHLNKSAIALAGVDCFVNQKLHADVSGLGVLNAALGLLPGDWGKITATCDSVWPEFVHAFEVTEDMWWEKHRIFPVRTAIPETKQHGAYPVGWYWERGDAYVGPYETPALAVEDKRRSQLVR